MGDLVEMGGWIERRRHKLSKYRIEFLNAVHKANHKTLQDRAGQALKHFLKMRGRAFDDDSIIELTEIYNGNNSRTNVRS